MAEACIARQPIFNGDRNIFGYELLFRPSQLNAYGQETDGDFATTSLISDSVHLHGLDQLTGGARCFVNVTRNALLHEVYAVLPPERTVVEVLESVEPDEEVIAGCRRVRELGYALALDDYVLDERFALFLPLIDILKVEFTGTNIAQQAEIGQMRRQFGFELLAEKVEEPEQFQRARRNGFTLFQGYFFCKPEMLQSKRLPSSRLNYLQFLQEINKEEIDLDKVEAHIRQELSLSYKLLRYLNSASFGLRHTVHSIRHAMTLLGEKSLRKWASLVAINELNSDKPTELMTTCLIRARFCELLGKQQGSSTRSDLFTLGMFSLLDAMLDRPMQELVKELALPEELRDALVVDEPSFARAVLETAVAFERGEWEKILQLLSTLRLDEGDASTAYREAILWSTDMTKQLSTTDGNEPPMKAAS